MATPGSLGCRAVGRRHGRLHVTGRKWQITNGRLQMTKGPDGKTVRAFLFLVGARGFEPPTTCTPCRYATRLRYAPKKREYITVDSAMASGSQPIYWCRAIS